MGGKGRKKKIQKKKRKKGGFEKKGEGGDQSETEPNNTIIQNIPANTFNAPDSISASITTSSPDDKDFFKIVLPYCGSWSFNLINPIGSPCVLRMYLYNGQNTSNVIISSGGVVFDFNAGIPDPVIINCGGIMYIQIDQTSGADLGAYSLEITENTFSGFVCNTDSGLAQLVTTDTTLESRLYGYDLQRKLR
ncbi:MAG: hypothetical protein IPP27_02375 [Bacteroidetes bacterium]|nr:hypothetical protein [Bacteroidota bacterium]